MLIMLPVYKGWVAVALKSFASFPRAPKAGDRWREWFPEVKAEGMNEPEPETFLMFLRCCGGNYYPGSYLLTTTEVEVL